VIINPGYHADHNGAFLAAETNPFNSRDIIDSFTSAHRVLYYEAEDENEVIHTIAADLERLGCEASILLIGGHGTPENIHLGDGQSLFDSASGYVDASDFKALQLLGSKVKAGGTVILLSCSAAGTTEDGSENIATVIHNAMSHTHVYAPASLAGGQIVFDYNGEFEQVDYSFARKTHIEPGGKIETESLTSSVAGDAALLAKHSVQFAMHNKLLLVKNFLMATAIMMYLSSAYRSIGSALRNSKPQEEPGTEDT
jgi:hypothetical protein